MQVSLQAFKNWVYSNPQQAAHTLDQATTLFTAFVAAETVGVGCYYSSLSKKTIFVAGAVSLVTTFFLVYTRKWIAKVEQEQKEKINDFNDKGYTRLHHAVIDAPIEEIKSLLLQGASIHAKVQPADQSQEGNWGNTPLHFATRHGRLDVVTLFLEKGCTILEENNLGENSIHLAGETARKEIFDLLKQKANIEDENDYIFYNVFDLAGYGYLENLKLHMGKNINIQTSDEDGFTLLHHAAKRGELDTVKYLITENADKEAKTPDNLTPYMLAYRNGWNEVTQFLKSQDCSTDLGTTTFIWKTLATSWTAVSTGRYSYGANPSGRDAEGKTALHYLSEPSQIKEILKLDPSLVNVADQNGNTPLHLVQSVDLLELLCQHEALIDVENKWKQTPLNCALEKGKLKVAEALLQRNAKLNASATNGKGEPFLHCFIRKDKGEEGVELLKKLLEKYPVNLDLRNSKEETCLHVAAEQWDTNPMILFLLEQNPALINLQDSLGQTALHRTYRLESRRNILIKKGANLSLTDNKGLTPLALHQQKEEEKKEKGIRMREASRNSIYSSRNW
jgi:ankyrin repeat protein